MAIIRTARPLNICFVTVPLLFAGCSSKSVIESAETVDTNTPVVSAETMPEAIATSELTQEGIAALEQTPPESHRYAHPDRQQGINYLAQSSDQSEPVVSNAINAENSTKAEEQRSVEVVENDEVDNQTTSQDELIEEVKKLPATAAGTQSSILTQKLDQGTSKIDLKTEVAFNSNASYAEQCTISTPSTQLDSENFSSQIWFSFEGGKLLLHSTAKIRSAHGTSSLIVDNESVPFNSEGSLQTALWSGEISDLDFEEAPQLSLVSNDLGRVIYNETIDVESLLEARNKYVDLCALQGNESANEIVSN